MTKTAVILDNSSFTADPDAAQQMREHVQEALKHPSDRIVDLIGRERTDALFRDALAGFVTEAPPRWAQAWANRVGDGASADRLQEWVVMHLRSLWMTGIGAIEAAEHMLVVAYENANLHEPAAVEEIDA